MPAVLLQRAFVPGGHHPLAGPSPPAGQPLPAGPPPPLQQLRWLLIPRTASRAGLRRLSAGVPHHRPAAQTSRVPYPRG